MKAIQQVNELDGQRSVTYEIVEATPQELDELAAQEGNANEWVEANADIIAVRDMTGTTQTTPLRQSDT